MLPWLRSATLKLLGGDLVAMRWGAHQNFFLVVVVGEDVGNSEMRRSEGGGGGM